jgi:hypothetical protein
VILHGDHFRVRRATVPFSFDANFIVKLKRQARKKNRVLRAAKLHHGRFAQTRAPGPQRGYLYWDSNGGRAWKKASQQLRAPLPVLGQRYFAGSSHVASQLVVVLSY